VLGDLTARAGVLRLAEEIRQRNPTIDVLVHNAGVLARSL
jgi:NAD(P)-dependent dehydrogenase (short-subunit alcohol dehydrogenase family)